MLKTEEPLSSNVSQHWLKFKKLNTDNDVDMLTGAFCIFSSKVMLQESRAFIPLGRAWVDHWIWSGQHSSFEERSSVRGKNKELVAGF